MDIADLNAATARLVAKGAVQAGPIVSQTPDRMDHVVADLIVDLSTAMTAAFHASAASLAIYCDTLVVNGVNTIDKSPGRVSVIARSVVAGTPGDDASFGLFRLSHFDKDSASRLRLICRIIEGSFSIVSASKSDRTEYDLSALRTPHPVPQFSNFVSIDGRSEVHTTPVPIGLLANGEPLHKTLAASFALAAGLLAEDDANVENAALAYAVLSWLSDWSGLQDDIADIARLSERLRVLIPREVDEKLTIPIPDRTSAAYLDLLAARQQYAHTVELDGKFVDQEGTVADIARAFAQSTSARDDIEIERIKREIETLQDREPVLRAALQTSAQAVADFRFQQKLDKIQLDLAVELDKIDKIVSASFEIAMGVVTLGASIAAICLGVPADPGAAAKKDIEGVEGLIGAFKTNWKSSNPGNPFDFFRHIDNLLFLYKVPFTFIWKNKSSMQDSFKALISSGLAIKAASSRIRTSGSKHDDFDEVVSTLNDALRNLAEKPGVIEARAAWDAMEAESVNQLDRVINDGSVVVGIKDAATNYKTTVQKMAIYGRAMAEHQAAIDSNQRDIAARLLQRCAQISKRKVTTGLELGFSDRAALNAHISADLQNRRESAARSFFVAGYGYRRAQYYETFTLPATPVGLSFVMADMAQTLSGLKTDISDAAADRGSREIDFKDTLVFDDPEELKRLAAGESITWVISSEQISRRNYYRLRMSRVELHLEMPESPNGTISFDLLSTTSFSDRLSDGSALFTGSMVLVPFDYDASGVSTRKTFTEVLPTPFSAWLVTLRKGAGKDVTALKLSVEGRALQ